jgi:hypothetical protein
MPADVRAPLLVRQAPSLLGSYGCLDDNLRRTISSRKQAAFPAAAPNRRHNRYRAAFFQMFLGFVHKIYYVIIVINE